jgi:hypothetical protein
LVSACFSSGWWRASNFNGFPERMKPMGVMVSPESKMTKA